MELQFWKNGEIVIDDVSPEQQKMLTTWYTEHAVDFIARHADEPFFSVRAPQYAACAAVLQR